MTTRSISALNTLAPMKRVLFLYGGFPGHRPYELAKWARGLMDDLGFEVEEIQDPHRFEQDLTVYDLIVLGWTQSQTTEDLTDKAEQRLIEAAQSLANTFSPLWNISPSRRVSFQVLPSFSTT